MTLDDIVDGGEYVDETFNAGGLRERTILGVTFESCRFVDIDASLARYIDCSFSEVAWHNAKLVGVDWTLAAWPAFGLHAAMRFEDCQMDYGVFDGLKLAKSHFDGSRLREASFREADLRGASLERTDLTGTDFTGADLREADLAGAVGYAIDPASTRIQGMRVSHPEAESFLHSLGLVVAPVPEKPA